MKTETEVLVPRIRKINIAGQPFEIHQYSARDLITFSRELIGGLAKLKEKYPSLEFKQEDMLIYMPLLLDEIPRLFDLIALTLRPEKTGDWLQEQTDLVGVSDLFASVCEMNDFGAVISNFRRGWDMLKKQTIKKVSAEQ